MKKVILIILTLCSLFIYSCDGGSGGGGPIGIVGPNDPVVPPDPNNVRSLYGTYELTDMDTWIEAVVFSCNSPNLTGRLVFKSYSDAYYSFDCIIPGIGVIYDDFKSKLEFGEESWKTKAELEGENVKFITDFGLEGGNIVKGKKISDSTIVNYNLTPFTRTKTPLSSDNYSTLTGTYIVEDAKAYVQYTDNGQLKSMTCTAVFLPNTTTSVASLEVTTRSAFFGINYECIDDQTGLKEENYLLGYGQVYNYGDGFVQGNWAGGGEPVILDETTVILPIAGPKYNGTISGEIKLRKIYDAIEIISKSDM